MTRRTALTVRLPGASTMPVTSTSTCSQTGAVKKLRKGAISEMTIGGRIETRGSDRMLDLLSLLSFRRAIPMRGGQAVL